MGFFIKVLGKSKIFSQVANGNPTHAIFLEIWNNYDESFCLIYSNALKSTHKDTFTASLQNLRF